MGNWIHADSEQRDTIRANEGDMPPQSRLAQAISRARKRVFNLPARNLDIVEALDIVLQEIEAMDRENR